MDYRITRWGSDPFSLGSYSFMKVGATPAHIEGLAHPVLNRLFFAGEATSSEHPSTVHGALVSGVDCAQMVVECADAATARRQQGGSAAAAAGSGALGGLQHDVLLDDLGKSSDRTCSLCLRKGDLEVEGVIVGPFLADGGPRQGRTTDGAKVRFPPVVCCL